MIQLFFWDKKYNPIKVEKMHQQLVLLHVTSWIMSPMQLPCKDIHKITEKTAQMTMISCHYTPQTSSVPTSEGK
jgi:hypothetical protein